MNAGSRVKCFEKRLKGAYSRVHRSWSQGIAVESPYVVPSPVRKE